MPHSSILVKIEHISFVNVSFIIFIITFVKSLIIRSSVSSSMPVLEPIVLLYASYIKLTKFSIYCLISVFSLGDASISVLSLGVSNDRNII